MCIFRVFSDLGRASVNLRSTGLFREKVVLSHYRGFQMPHGERFDEWLAGSAFSNTLSSRLRVAPSGCILTAMSIERPVRGHSPLR